MTKYHVDLSELPEGAVTDFVVQHDGPPLVRTSERKDFKKCPWLWHESWVKGITTKRTPTWSWFGTAFHAGLEVRYQVGAKRGKRKAVLEAAEASMDNEIRKVYTEGGELEEDDIVDGRTLLFAMLNGYIDHYGPEKDIYVVHSEQSFQIDVPDPANPNGPPICVYAGTWDAIFLIDSYYWIVDHKTRKTFPANLSFYDIDDQAGSYLWVAPEVLVHMGVLSKKDTRKIMGLIFNLARKQMPDKRPDGPDGLKHNNPLKQHYIEALSPVMDLPARTPTIPVLAGYAEERGIQVWGEVSKNQPSPLFQREVVERSLRERVTQGQRVQREAQWMNAVRNGTMPLFKTPGEDCARCQLFDYCQADEHDPTEAREVAAAVLRNRDPYVSHRAMMEKNGVELRMHAPTQRKK